MQCQHCGQGALARDKNGPVCPDCWEEGYFDLDEAPTYTTEERGVRAMEIAVWFSCGAASAVAAWQTIRQYPMANVRILNNPIAEEDEDNLRFLCDVEDWLRATTQWEGRIEFVRHDKYKAQSCVEVWDDVSFMSGKDGAPCTKFLKKHARQQWEKSNRIDYHVLGFTADEEKRHKRFTTTERENVLPVLINAGITKADCYQILLDAGLALPRVSKASLSRGFERTSPMTNEQKTEAPDHICVEPNYNAFGDPSWGAYLHENVGVAYTRTALSQAAVGAVVRACAEAIDDPDFTQEDVNYVDNGHKWVLLEEAQTAILALIDQPSALDEALAAAKAEGVREAIKVVQSLDKWERYTPLMVVAELQALLPTKQKDET